VIDDFADDAKFSRHSPLLSSLFCKGRHNMISTIVANQKWQALSTIIRMNACQLYIYRLRNQTEIDSLVEELSALYPKKTILEIYNLATSSPHSFLYIKLTEHDKRNMFYKNLTEK